MTSPFPCDVPDRADALVIRFPFDSLGTGAVWSVPGDLARLAIESGSDRLILDLGSVTYLTAAALGGLIALREQLRSCGVDLRLCGVGPLPYDVFEATGLTRLFDIREGGPDMPPWS
jgi:anti-anti-sigma regulatory factor